jgi:hypothetical protein
MAYNKKMPARYHFAIGLMVVFILSTCSVVSSPNQERPLNTPVPPHQLENLPKDAQISCHNDPVLDRGAITLWSLPGLEPVDPESNPTANRGQRIGSLLPCTPIAITDIAWSETDQEFYLFVETSNIAEAGWVSLSLITIDE